MTAKLLPAAGYVLDLPVNPVPQGRPRTYLDGSRSRTVTPERSRAFRDEFATALLTCRPRPTPPGLDTPIAVTLRCWRHTRNGMAGDVDNLAKAVLDAGNQLLWTDDRHVRRLHVELVAAGPHVTGRIWLRVASLTPNRATTGTEHRTPDERYADVRRRLATLITTGQLLPGVRAELDQYGQGLNELLALADVDVRDPIVERAVLRLFDVLLLGVTHTPRDARAYLTVLAAGIALNVGLDHTPDPGGTP